MYKIKDRNTNNKEIKSVFALEKKTHASDYFTHLRF
jgi:hypothetical protein